MGDKYANNEEYYLNRENSELYRTMKLVFSSFYGSFKVQYVEMDNQRAKLQVKNEEWTYQGDVWCEGSEWEKEHIKIVWSCEKEGWKSVE